jgi:hypothetical protein
MTLGEESVYALIPPPHHAPARPIMHRSRFPGRLDRTTLVQPLGVAKRTDAHATFGRPDGCNAHHPTDFVRAHAREPSLPLPAPPTQRKIKVKECIPKRTEQPTMNLVSAKNFVTSNAVEAILSKPKSQAAPMAFTMKEDFGKVPRYLELNKAKVAREKAQVEEYLKTRDAQV